MLAPLLNQSPLFGQGRPDGDAAKFDHDRTTHRVEAGINALGSGLEYRFQWIPFLSTDALLSVSRPGVGFGVTISPVWLVFVQGVVGTGAYEEASAEDGPAPFNPNYLYGWKAGFRIPIAPKKTIVYFMLAAGQVKYVQNHYQYFGGGLLLDTRPLSLYRTETRAVDVFSVGLGITF